MGLYAFFRLARRPAILLVLASAISFAMIIFVGDALLQWASGGDPDLDNLNAEQIAHLLNLAVVGLPLLAGLLSADLAYDVRTRSFSWLLPELNAKLLRSVVLIGLAAVTATAVLHVRTGGAGDGLAVWGLGALVFAFGHHMLDRPWPRAVTVTGWGLVVVVLVLVDPLVRGASRVPLLSAGIGVVLAAVILRAAYSRANARAVASLESVLSLVNVLNPFARARYDRARRLRLAAGAGRWRGGRPTDTAAWARAAAFETCGFRRPGQLWIAVLAAPLFLGLLAAASGFQDGYEIQSSLAHGWIYAYHALFHPGHLPSAPGLETTTNAPPHLMAVAMISHLFYQANGVGTPLLGLGRVYPLSRGQRARVAWRSSLYNNAVVLGTAVAMFAAVGAVVWAVADVGPPPLRLPGFLRAALAAFVIAPLIQLGRVAYVSRAGRPRIGWNVAFVAVAVAHIALVVSWVSAQELRLGDAPLLELGLFFLLAAGTQTLYRASVGRHYARVDLV